MQTLLVHKLFVFSVHVVMDNLLLTIKSPMVPYVIMESFSSKNADLLNVVNKNRKLADLHDGTPFSNPRILKAFLLTNIRDIESDRCSSSLVVY